MCSVHQGMFSASDGVQYIRGYHEYIGGYHEYIGECSIHRGDIMSTSRMFSISGEYHEYIGGIS